MNWIRKVSLANWIAILSITSTVFAFGIRLETNYCNLKENIYQRIASIETKIDKLIDLHIIQPKS
jgi:uncharacterized membrane protein